jgi:phenylalanyl-tRNA synthetase beta chain
MLISLNWIRDFVDMPAGLDPRELAERFTRTTAEVDGVHRVDVGARGLMAARIDEVKELPGTKNLRLVSLNVGGGKTVQSVSAAPVLHKGLGVVYAPPEAHVSALGTISQSTVAGHESFGMILPGHALGIELAAQEAVFLDSSVQPGTPLPPEWFDDWMIEVDNKSITHRPDLWGHYGIAREVAAILGVPLRPYPVEPIESLTGAALSEVPIVIADPDACRRYSGLVLQGVPTQPAPLWMQLRLGRAGMRPITGLVDLTNYIMAELGQPMHAFDAAKVDRIEVDWAKEGEVFRTLDGMDRTLTNRTLMIKSGGRSVAIAGVMGGLESEVADTTTMLLLESANFDSSTIRRTATRLGMRTDASARFEKSLDPEHTVLAIQRFVALARDMYPNMQLASRLSDAYPKPFERITVGVNPRHVARTVGREVRFDEAERFLRPLGFSLSAQSGRNRHGGPSEQSGTLHSSATDTPRSSAVMVDTGRWDVEVPSYRATNDISIEADVIEEIMRYVGYDSLAPAMPRVSVRRFPSHRLHEIERTALEYFTTAHGFHEIHGYLWYDSAWIARLGYDPGRCPELRNPASEGLHRLRRSLMPGVLAAVEKNRFHFPFFNLIEIGSVFEVDGSREGEFRHMALVMARRGKKIEDQLYAELKGAIEGWAWRSFGRGVVFSEPRASARADAAQAEACGSLNNDGFGGNQPPWVHPHATANIVVEDVVLGRVSLVDAALRRTMDEHLVPWGIVWAEIRLDNVALLDPRIERSTPIPPFPLVELDFSFVVPRTTRFNEVVQNLAAFRHELLKYVRFIGSYESEVIGADARSLTFRTVIGHDERTLVEDDANSFRAAMEAHLRSCGYEIRQ